MIPYPRDWPKPPNEEQKLEQYLTTTPYKGWDTSPQDSYLSADRGPPARDVNLAFRYAAPVCSESEMYKSVFCQSSVDWVSDQVTSRLAGLHPEGKNIIVPDPTILSVLDSFYNNGFYMDVDLARQQTVMFISEAVRNDMTMEQQNDKLSVWNSIFTPDKGMAQINGIKLNERKPATSWAWNY